MGLFDKVLGGNANVSLSPQEAFAGVMMAVIASDGHISDDEAANFNLIINRTQLFQVQSASEHKAMIDKLFGILKKNDAEFLMLRAAEAMPAGMRETAFAVVTDLIFADGSVEDEEKHLLEKLQGILEIPDELALQMVRIMEIKNRN